MTMDVQKYRNYDESSDTKITNIECSKTEKANIDGKPTKRSFDVAFLMLPDEKLKQKQLRISKQLFEQGKERPYSEVKIEEKRDNNEVTKQYEERYRKNNNDSPNNGQDVNIDVGTDEYPGRIIYCSDSDISEKSRSRPASNESATRSAKYLPEFRNKVYDDPGLILYSRNKFEQMNRYFNDKSSEQLPKSAFTKVSNYSNYNVRMSPNPSLSPDNLIYQNSISPPLSSTTPPTHTFNKSFNNLITPSNLMNGNPFLKASLHTTSATYHEATRSNIEESSEKPSEQMKMTPPALNKFNSIMGFRPDIPPYLQPPTGYPFAMQNFQAARADLMKFSQPREPVSPLITNPAAAILSTLIPPTLAAFSLPAQNMCAKCNISFRMTSDLVYHMRTHHKSETTHDPSRRKREEKLKCPVCNESFRERHHLTRHMTAHQDKESDINDHTAQVGYSKSKFKQSFFNNASLHK